MSVPVYPFGSFPEQTGSVISPSGSISRLFFFLLQTLWRRTGGASGLQNTVGMGIASSGTTQDTAQQLVDDYSEVTINNAGVALVVSQPSQWQAVYNGTGGFINVYPPSGGKIDALAVNAPYLLPNGKTQVFTVFSQNTAGAPLYRSLQLG